MNSGQEKFFEFIILRVSEENQDKAKALLNESFSKQADGTFNKEYMLSFIPRMLELIKPDFVDEVKAIMDQYRA